MRLSGAHSRGPEGRPGTRHIRSIRVPGLASDTNPIMKIMLKHDAERHEMKHFKPILAASVAALLQACVSSGAPLGDPPSAGEIEVVARNAHQQSYGRPPVDLRIGQLHQVPMFFDSNEWMVCVSHEARTLGPILDNRGTVLAPEGTTYRQSSALHLKLYDFGWGSGIYRRVEAGRIGQVEISDYCPASSQPW